jgi:hypothetical protein
MATMVITTIIMEAAITTGGEGQARAMKTSTPDGRDIRWAATEEEVDTKLEC